MQKQFKVGQRLRVLPQYLEGSLRMDETYTMIRATNDEFIDIRDSKGEEELGWYPHRFKAIANNEGF